MCILMKVNREGGGAGEGEVLAMHKNISRPKQKFTMPTSLLVDTPHKGHLSQSNYITQRRVKP